MIACGECEASKLQTGLGPCRAESFGARAAAMEPFVQAAARYNGGVFFPLPAPGDARRYCGAELHPLLKIYTSRGSAALKMLALPPPANPARVRRWLETSLAHISPVCSPLKERGPPHS